MKKFIALLLAVLMVFGLTACGGGNTADSEKVPFKIAIVTGSVSQSEDDYRGAEAFQAKYGKDMVVLATYPDNFAEDVEGLIESITAVAADPDVKAVIVNQGVPGTNEAFKQIREKRDDVLLLVGEDHNAPETYETSDLTINNDSVARGYLMVKTAHDLGCENFVHISFNRHLSYPSMQRRIACMQEACKDFGMSFYSVFAPDPSLEGTAPAQQYVTENIPVWIDQYGTNSAFFCTNDAHTEPLLAGLLEYGGYFIEADLPSPIMGYPSALGLDLTDCNGDFDAILKKVEQAVVDKGGAGRFGTWACSYGYTLSYGLAQHAYNVLSGVTADVKDVDALSAALKESSGLDWNGSCYVDENTGVKSENGILVYQDTYIMGKGFMGVTEVEVPEKYFTLTGVDLTTAE